MPPRTTPTGPRGSRGPSRGGITKHRTGPTKVDKDGDMVMGASGGISKPTGKGRPEGSSRGRAGHISNDRSRTSTPQAQAQAIARGMRTQQVNIIESRASNASRRKDVEILVRGLKESKASKNADGGLKDLLSFLERKASALDGAPKRGIRTKKSRRKGDDVLVTASEADGEWILKVNNFTFAGATLSVQLIEDYPAASSLKGGDAMSEEAKDIQEKIRAILATRYDASLKLLNLSALGTDPGLVQMGIFDAESRISKLFPVLMVVCDRLFDSAQQKREAIVSVTLADNELDNLKQISTLAQTFPDILNLDLSRNKFTSLKQLDSWQHKFRRLQNLRLLENPIDASPDYKVELAKWYPTLQILNDVQIRTPEVIEAALQAKKATKKSPIPINGPDFRDFNGIGEGFVRQFFPLYDNDRISLANTLYDQQSTHSISVNTSAPRAEDQAKTAHSWSAYIRQSRNLMKVTTLSARQSRTYTGVEAITKLWSELPATRHPDLTTQTAKYLVDCHPISGLPDVMGQSSRGVDGMMLMVHGEFDEKKDNDPEIVTRSFSRTFILGPGLPGKAAIRVVSDVVVLRAWSPLATAATEEGAPAGQGIADAEEAQKQKILLEVMQRTYMTSEYATMCLTEAAWDLEKSLVIFEQNKGKLPPDAFSNGVSA